MFKKILVATDGSELADKAVAGAIDYASNTGAALVGVSVVNPMPMIPFSDGAPMMVWDDVLAAAEDFATDILRKLSEAAAAQGLSCETVMAKHTEVWVGILETAKAHQCDAIFIASHGRKGVSALILGSSAQKVLTHTDLPVLVYH